MIPAVLLVSPIAVLALNRGWLARIKTPADEVELELQPPVGEGSGRPFSFDSFEDWARPCQELMAFQRESLYAVDLEDLRTRYRAFILYATDGAEEATYAPKDVGVRILRGLSARRLPDGRIEVRTPHMLFERGAEVYGNVLRIPPRLGRYPTFGAVVELLIHRDGSGGGLDVSGAIPIVMGSNVGTSVTNRLSPPGTSTDPESSIEPSRPAAVMDDFFELLSILVLSPLQLTTDFLGVSSGVLSDDLDPNEVSRGPGGGTHQRQERETT